MPFNACLNIPAQYSISLLPSKNTTYINQQYVNITLHSWQHVSAVNSHQQATIEQSLGTLKVCTLWDPIRLTIIGILKVVC